MSPPPQLLQSRNVVCLQISRRSRTSTRSLCPQSLTFPGNRVCQILRHFAGSCGLGGHCDWERRRFSNERGAYFVRSAQASASWLKSAVLKICTCLNDTYQSFAVLGEPVSCIWINMTSPIANFLMSPTRRGSVLYGGDRSSSKLNPGR